MNHWITPTKRLVHDEYVRPILADPELRALVPDYDEMLATLEPLRIIKTMDDRDALQNAKASLNLRVRESLYASGCIFASETCLDDRDDTDPVATFAGKDSVLRDSWDKILQLAGDEPILLYRKANAQH